MLDLTQDGVTIGCERIIAGPDPIDDLHPRIISVRMDADQSPPARSERTSGATTFDALNSTLARAR
jgi:hypothetical protein